MRVSVGSLYGRVSCRSCAQFTFFALGQRYIKLVGTNSTKFRAKITVVYIVVTNIDCQYNDDFLT